MNYRHLGNADFKFEVDDHRDFNRNGKMFNVGETFAGLDFEKGVELSNKVNWIVENRENMTRAALKWILEHEAISCVIPGFKNVAQVEDNLQAVNVEEFTEAEMNRLAQFYKNEVHREIKGAY